MENSANITLVRKLFDEIYSKGNLNAFEELFSKNLVVHDPAVPHGKEDFNAYKETENNYKRAFPNKKAKIDLIFSSDDKVVALWTCQGTHKGDLQGISASNQNFTITGISIYKLSNSKIVEVWQSWDRLGLLEQLGEIEPAAALHGSSRY